MITVTWNQRIEEGWNVSCRGILFSPPFPSSRLFCAWQTGEAWWRWKVSLWLRTSDGMTHRQREWEVSKTGRRRKSCHLQILSLWSLRLTSCQPGQLILCGTKNRQGRAFTFPNHLPQTISGSLQLLQYSVKNQMWNASTGSWIWCYNKPKSHYCILMLSLFIYLYMYASQRKVH